jgi:protein-disulfide isomerase
MEERLARRDAPRPKKSSGRRIGIGWLSLVGLVGGLAVVALAIVLGGTPKATPTSVSIVRAPAGIATDGMVLGAATAPVTIDLYEDFQCPVCESWGQTVFPSLAANELAKGTAKLAFHNMAFIGPESVAAGHAAYAAAQQGRFWDFWATLYANQGRENGGAFSREHLVEMATGLGLDVARFESDMDSPAASTALTNSIAAANGAGVNATPTLVIAGQAYTGVKPYPDIAAAIAAAAGTAP